MLNHIVIQGRFVRDPELRHTAQGTPVVSFTLAVDRDYQSGGSEKQTDFIDCVGWRNTAEFIGKYFHKGSMAVVAGSLQMRKWTDKNDNNRVSAEVVVSNIYFADSKKTNTGNSEGDYTEPTLSEYDDEEEMPF